MDFNPADHSDDAIRERLGFTAEWFELGIVDDAALAEAVDTMRASGDTNPEHYRHRAFMAFVRRCPALTEEQCHRLVSLGNRDADRSMGTAIMLHVLARPECPNDLLQLATTLPRTARYATAILRKRNRSDGDQIKDAMQSLGPRTCYRRLGFRPDGKREKDQTAYHAMRMFFDLDFNAFLRIRNAVDSPDTMINPTTGDLWFEAPRARIGRDLTRSALTAGVSVGPRRRGVRRTGGQ